MNEKRTSTIAICLTVLLAFSPLITFVQSTTTFSGEAVALKANAVGISLALADTGALPSSGGNLSTSLASVNVAGIASADTLSSSTSGSGSGGQASTSGNAQLVGLTVAGQSIVVSNPNLSISLPGGISVIINQQTSSSGGTSGSITVNALHVTGPSLDIVVASAQSDITCS